MSNLVLGVRIYLYVPPPESSERVTAQDIAGCVDLHVRSAQRHLVALERAGLIEKGETRPARWRRTST